MVSLFSLNNYWLSNNSNSMRSSIFLIFIFLICRRMHETSISVSLLFLRLNYNWLSNNLKHLSVCFLILFFFLLGISIGGPHHEGSVLVSLFLFSLKDDWSGHNFDCFSRNFFIFFFILLLVFEVVGSNHETGISSCLLLLFFFLVSINNNGFSDHIDVSSVNINVHIGISICIHIKTCWWQHE